MYVVSCQPEKEVMVMSRRRSGVSGLVGLLLGAILIISGCGGGGGGSNSSEGTTPVTPPVTPLTTLSGTAAAGAPIQGTVNLRDSAGTTRTQTINPIVAKKRSKNSK